MELAFQSYQFWLFLARDPPPSPGCLLVSGRHRNIEWHFNSGLKVNFSLRMSSVVRRQRLCLWLLNHTTTWSCQSAILPECTSKSSWHPAAHGDTLTHLVVFVWFLGEELVVHKNNLMGVKAALAHWPTSVGDVLKRLQPCLLCANY